MCIPFWRRSVVPDLKLLSRTQQVRSARSNPKKKDIQTLALAFLQAAQTAHTHIPSPQKRKHRLQNGLHPTIFL